MTFCDNLLKSFSENLKQLTKMNDFLLFLRFYQNRRILHCFHCRYEFCLQKYHSKCIFIEFAYEGTISANFIKGYSFAIQPIILKIWKFENLLYLSSFPSKNNILWLFFWQSAQEFQWKSQTTKKNEWFSIIFAFSWKP